MNISRSATVKVVAGPLPSDAQSPAGAPYSGLLECPTTTRLTKVVSGAYVLRRGAGCAAPILTLQECFHAARVALGTGLQTFENEVGTDAGRPRGHTATTSDAADPLASEPITETELMLPPTSYG